MTPAHQLKPATEFGTAPDTKLKELEKVCTTPAVARVDAYLFT
jgi:hypothetical protein